MRSPAPRALLPTLALVLLGTLVTLGSLGTLGSAATAIGASAAAPDRPAYDARSQRPTATGARVDDVVLNPRLTGRQHMGVGALSGGGGNSRLLIDYPEPQRSRILDYLFKPGYGASLQILKLEIGGGSNSTSGAEPSVETVRGQVRCNEGYQWWVAEQAVRRNPRLQLVAMPWGGPGWLGDQGDPGNRRLVEKRGEEDQSRELWTANTVKYDLRYLDCARQHGLRIDYLGGWNERLTATKNSSARLWFQRMRAALDQHGYRRVRLIAGDTPPQPDHWDTIAQGMLRDLDFAGSVDVVGVHDVCGYPPGLDTTPYAYSCRSTPEARSLTQPLWGTEQGKMDSTRSAATEMRQLTNAYPDAGVTGLIMFPLLTSMVDEEPLQNRGLITAKWPWSGQYTVNPLLWPLAQMTQFVPAGWWHLDGANRNVGASTTYDSFVSPDRRQWSLVAQNTGQREGQEVQDQILRIRPMDGLSRGRLQVRATDLWSREERDWFVPVSGARVRNGTVDIHVPPGYAVSVTSRTAPIGKGGSPGTRPSTVTLAPLSEDYDARRDRADLPRYLSPNDGTYAYERCQGGRRGECLQQSDTQTPVYWIAPDRGPRFPMALLGESRWSGYTIGSDVLFTGDHASAGLVSHMQALCSMWMHQCGSGNDHHFDGYELLWQTDGRWQVVRDTMAGGRHRMAAGRVAAPGLQTWHRLELAVHDQRLVARIDNREVAAVKARSWRHGLAGIDSSWSRVQYDHLTVRDDG